MKKLKTLLPFLVILLVSLPAILKLYPRVHQFGGISFKLEQDSIEARANQIVKNLGFPLKGFKTYAKLNLNRPLIHQMQEKYGLEEANRLLREKVPGYYWEIDWKKTEIGTIHFGVLTIASENNDSLINDLRNVNLHLDTNGNLLKYERPLADTLSLDSLSRDVALKAANDFIRKYGIIRNVNHENNIPGSLPENLVPSVQLQLENQKKIEQGSHTEYEFTWTIHLPDIDNKIRLGVQIAGNRITRYDAEYIVPEKYQNSGSDILSGIFAALIFIVVSICTVIIAFKRVRVYEINFRMGIALGLLMAILVGIELYFILRGTMGWEIVLALLFGPLLYGGAFVFVWAVGESIGRETWKEKFISLDLLSNGHVFHSRIGENLIRGISIGAGGFAVWLALIWLSQNFTHLWFISGDENILRYFYSPGAVLQLILHNTSYQLYALSIYMILILTLLRRRFSSPLFIISICGFLLGISLSKSIHPLQWRLVIDSLSAILLMWGFYRFDILSGFFSLFTFHTLFIGTAFLMVGDSAHLQSGYFLIGFFLFLLISALIAIFTRDQTVNFDAIAPAFQRYISERQRLQRELEIARHVQMSFLPDKNPHISQLDIACQCEPALEIGGDYYDFMELGPKKLGVVVGDVSGKGTQAAFYMTLTKGFLKALAKVSSSPAVVLTKMNKLFYENVKRGTFISMVYGVFDIEVQTVTLARAGHNPIIMRKTQQNEVEVIHPGGIALGLEKGEKFSGTIQEVKIFFNPGDLFVFYTDGFIEARNKQREEFGEDRFHAAVKKYSNGSAYEVMQGVFSEVKHFIGKAHQHDDMTMVVVRII